MFEKHRQKRAAQQYQRELVSWQQQRDDCAAALDVARTYAGEPSSEIMLKSGERVFAGIAGAALIEDRRGAGHWEGRSSGVSVPVGSLGGRSIRCRTGGSRGHYVQGTTTPTAIDTGTLYVTNMRVIFQGSRQTRECLFSKLVGFRHDDTAGTTTFSVSNRQKPTTIHYGPDVSAWFDFRLDLALAHYRSAVGALVSDLQDKLARIDARRPLPPSQQTGAASARPGGVDEFLGDGRISGSGSNRQLAQNAVLTAEELAYMHDHVPHSARKTRN